LGKTEGEEVCVGPGTELGIAVAVTTAVNRCHLSKQKFRNFFLPFNKQHLSLKWGESLWRLDLHMQNPSSLFGKVAGCTVGQGFVTCASSSGSERTGSILVHSCSL